MITATVNDTLTFIIDGTAIYVGLTAGLAVDAATIAANINMAFVAAGLAATADVTDDGCVRVTSTKPIGTGEIVMYGGTGMGTINIPPGLYAAPVPNGTSTSSPQQQTQSKDLADTIKNGSGANVSVTGPDQSSVIEATASGSTLTVASRPARRPRRSWASWATARSSPSAGRTARRATGRRVSLGAPTGASGSVAATTTPSTTSASRWAR